jgi:hypothetical protein
MRGFFLIQVLGLGFREASTDLITVLTRCICGAKGGLCHSRQTQSRLYCQAVPNGQGDGPSHGVCGYDSRWT